MAYSLLLLLKGAMQSWGSESRYQQRTSQSVPTKSGVVGLLAAAEGRRRSDPVEDLARLRFAVRVDQPGTLLRDYQTAQQWQTTGKTKLVTRYFLSDGVFVAGVESEDLALLEELESALKKPRFPLFLGRRSCPAPAGLVLGIRNQPLIDALEAEPWHASDFHRKQRDSEVFLPIYRDAVPGEEGIAQRDVPVSFSQERREYGWRKVVLEGTRVSKENPLGTTTDGFFEAVISA